MCLFVVFIGECCCVFEVFKVGMGFVINFSWLIFGVRFVFVIVRELNIEDFFF